MYLAKLIEAWNYVRLRNILARWLKLFSMIPAHYRHKIFTVPLIDNVWDQVMYRDYKSS